MVLLTLLSIVQALALEFLWTDLSRQADLYQLTWTALLTWIQIAANFLGIVLIWLIYACNVMRFRWLPGTSDSVFPFLIGIVEFVLIDLVGPDKLGWWLLNLALIFGLMAWVSQRVFTRARSDGENDEFFATVSPATLRDFYPAFGVVGGLILAGSYLAVSGDQGWIALVALLAAVAALSHQLYLMDVFWKRSLE